MALRPDIILIIFFVTDRVVQQVVFRYRSAAVYLNSAEFTSTLSRRVVCQRCIRVATLFAKAVITYERQRQKRRKEEAGEKR